jgi:hypothetical protein
LKRMIAAVFAATAVGVCGIAAKASAANAPASWFQNCTTVNKHYRHGVGKAGASDHTKGRHPVTTFLRSTSLYTFAMRINGDLDRDGDGVACENA